MKFKGISKFLIFFAICYLSATPSVEANDYTLEEILRILNSGINNTIEYIRSGYSDGSIEQDVIFFCKSVSGQDPVQVFINDPDIGSKINPSKPLLMIIHGFIDNGNRTWMKETAEDAVKYIDTNACIVSWGPRADIEYSIAANNTKEVGKFIGKFLNTTIRPLISLDKISIVGHSLGAHIAGFIGTYLEGKLGTIFGLDPAGPLFTLPVVKDISERLDPTDAKFVQVLHTTSLTLGTHVLSGHQDFFANAGISPQPGCVINVVTQLPCSHMIACEFFRSSLNSQNELKTIDLVDRYGYFSKRIQQTFFFLTAPKYPYVFKLF